MIGLDELLKRSESRTVSRTSPSEHTVCAACILKRSLSHDAFYLFEGSARSCTTRVVLCSRCQPAHVWTKYRWAQMRSRLCSRQLHVLYQAWCKLAFQLFNRVGPLEWFGSLVVVGNEVQDGLLKLIQVAEMIG